MTTMTADTVLWLNDLILDILQGKNNAITIELGNKEVRIERLINSRDESHIAINVNDTRIVAKKFSIAVDRTSRAGMIEELNFQINR